MKKRLSKLTALTLALVLLLSIIPIQAASAAPSPPSWWAKEDYLIFEGDPIYTSDAWNDILTVRQEVLNGVNIFDRQKSPTYENLRNLELHKESKTPAYYYEMALLNLGVFCTGAKKTTTNASHYLFCAEELLAEDHPYRRPLNLWYLRCYILDRELQDDSTYGLAYRDYRLARIDEKMSKYSITFAQLRNHPLMASVSQADWDDNAAKLEQYREELPAKLAAKEAEREAERKKKEAEAAAKAEAERSRIKIQLDGQEIQFPDVQPCIQNNRTMVPISPLAKAMGCTVKLDQTGTVTITRANDTIKMTFGKKTAYLNDQPVEMDVAPYVYQDRTMIPAAYVSKFFGQTIKMQKDLTVTIEENKSLVGESNLEAWALPMGSMLSKINAGNPSHFGLFPRGASKDLIFTIYHTTPYQFCRDQLSKGWSIENREDLIETVARMTFYGHNASFLYDAAVVRSLSSSEYKQLLSQAEGMDAYMWPYTKQLAEKWGDRGILCWDLFRMSNLVQWGYTAGYLSYSEALALLEPAAVLLCENFSSWEEAYENYLDGYNWWARNNVLGQDIWETERGVKYQEIKEKYGQIFDESLFETGVIPIPGLSFEDVLATLPDEIPN